MQTLELKTCSKCKIDLPIDSFTKDKTKKDGLTSYCRVCKREHGKKRWLENKDALSASHKIYYEQNKESAQAYGKKYYEENKEQAHAQCKKWREENKDKIHVIQKRYYSKNKDKIKDYRDTNKDKRKEYGTKYYIENKDQMLSKNKEYYEQNKEVIAEKTKKYYIENKDQILVRNKRYSEDNKEKLAESSKIWVEKNKDKVRNYRRTYKKEKLKTSVQFKLSESLRNRLRSAVVNGYKGGSAVRDLGCSIELLRDRIELQFKPGMTWDNWGFGLGKWHIDHIMPLSAFDLTNRQHFLLACHYGNLQPLWHEDNMRKLDKIPTWENYKTIHLDNKIAAPFSEAA